MSLLTALLETYDFALAQNLVDNPKLSVNGMSLLPIYHSNKKSNGEDIFEITVDKNSQAVAGGFLSKEVRVVFPVTEDSITRSGAQIAPHAICDELSYLSQEIDTAKNERFLQGIEELLAYEATNPCEDFRIIGKYILKNNILEDVLKFYSKGRKYELNEKFLLELTEEDGKTNVKSLDLNKVFITFKLEKQGAGDITLTNSKAIHHFYIQYVRDKNSTKELVYCDLTGNLEYCVERHRGIIGNAKMISISNHDETYYGRLKKGGDIYHIGYEASQKVHNMLKYLLDNSSHAGYIGEGAYVVNWLAHELDKGGIKFLSDLQQDSIANRDMPDEEFEDEDEFEEIPEATMAELGGGPSKVLKNYFMGNSGAIDPTGNFYVLLIEKISNGRVSIKHFKKLPSSEAYERLSQWYDSIEWKHFKTLKSPSCYQIVDFLYGYEDGEGKLKCEKDKLKRSQIERLIPCLLEGKELPKDMAKLAFSRLTKRQSYKKQWDTALYIGCALFKKYKNNEYVIHAEKIGEVEQLKESVSFYYGRLAAIYERVEIEGVRARDFQPDSGGEEEKDKGKKFSRVTIMSRFFTQMIRMPERTAPVVHQRLNPYFQMLMKRDYARYGYLNNLIAQIIASIGELKEAGKYKDEAINEDFYFGYYYQVNEFFKQHKKGHSKDKDMTESENEAIANEAEEEKQ